MDQTQFLNSIKEKAKKNPQIIVFPESEIDERVVSAAMLIANEKIAYPILLGKRTNFPKNLPDEIQVHDFLSNESQKEYYAEKLAEYRKDKGLTIDNARELLKDLNYYGTMMVKENHAHGMVSGSRSKTADSIKPAFEIIKTKEKFHKVSGFFFMVLPDQVLLFADCSININPTSEELAEIALDTARTAERFGLTPQVAMLSFQTNSSENIPEIMKVKHSVEIAKEQAPLLLVEGPIQVDAALVPEVAKNKWPESKIAGRANVLIFPDLNSGNIAYKLVERLARAKAIGPILQGLNQPINDLSRGCSVEDIVYMTAITSIEAQNITYN